MNLFALNVCLVAILLPAWAFGIAPARVSADTMTYQQSSVAATSLPAGRSGTNERLIAVNIITQGTLAPLELTEIRFNLEGTTRPEDMAIVRVWFNGPAPRLVTSELFGTGLPDTGSLVITGSQLLNEGPNYFWITADIKGTAVEGDTLKAVVESVTLSGVTHAVTPGATPEFRVIILEHQLLFSGGDYGSANYRIPAIVSAADGSVVVAVDARIDQPGDLPNDIDLMIRRSTDLGHTWSDPMTIADFGEDGAGDPALVLDRNSGDLLCLFASHQGLFLSTPTDPIRFQVCRSTDHGVSWTSPEEHTDEIYAPGWYASWLASGSAHQMRNGRIIGAVGVRENAGNTISNFMIFSDDGGHTWNYQPARAAIPGNEAKVVERDNGEVMMNIRNQTPDKRKITLSADGGASWGTPWYQDELIDPFVNGELIRYTSVLDGFDKSRLLFSIAAHPSVRKNLTLFLSYDEGGTWPVSRVVNPGLTGYSALTVLDDGTIGCFYENGEYEEYQLYFARVSLEWLTHGEDTFHFPVGTAEKGGSSAAIRVTPNPATHTLTVCYKLASPGLLKASIMDSAGRVVLAFDPEPLPAGETYRTLDIRSWSSGHYILKADVSGSVAACSFIVSK